MANSVVLSGKGSAEIEAVIEDMGGVDALLQLFADRKELTNRWLEAYPDMLEQYPDQWVAWGQQGVIAVAPSQRELLEMDEVKTHDSNRLFIEFLDTNPEVLIL